MTLMNGMLELRSGIRIWKDAPEAILQGMLAPHPARRRRWRRRRLLCPISRKMKPWIGPPIAPRQITGLPP